MKKIKLCLLLLLTGACSWDPQKATAFTNPPQPVKTSFQFEEMKGNYIATGSTTMFLWPEHKKDEATGDLVPMTFDEKMQARKQIFELSDEYELHNSNFDAAKTAIAVKYDQKSETLIEEWKTQACYSYCDPILALFCSPDNEENLEIAEDEWTSSEDPQVQGQIAACQQNQELRNSIKAAKAQEEDKVLTPLEKLASQATANLFSLITEDEDYTDFISDFKMDIGNFTCASDQDICQQSSEVNAYVAMNFDNQNISNYEGHQALPITQLSLDQQGGYMQFTMPYINPKSDQVEGEFRFDLEFKFTGLEKTAQKITGREVKVDGDFIRVTTEGERVGRFSSTWIIAK